VTFLEKQLADPGRFRRMKRVFYAGLALLALTEAAAPFFLYPDDGHFEFEDLPALGSVYGFFACVVIIVVSKVLGKLWIARRENYYDS
jgi:hypothetical protein